MATFTYDIEVKDDNGNELGSGTLTVTIDNSVNPPTKTGTFLPDDSTSAITCRVPTWNTSANGAVVWGFTLSSANGDFPAGNYNFTGTENASGTDPSGNVVWPNLLVDAEETVTWQGEATQPVEESQAYGQGAS